MLGVISLGQAGGNIGDSFMEKGIYSIAINYSSKDLDSLEYIQDKLTLFGSEGVGRNRKIATALMKNNWEAAVNFVKQYMSTPSIEVILIVFSASGGSGSGIAPILTEFLNAEMNEKTFVLCPILPSYDEVLVNQVNTLATLEEISDLNNLILPIDNQKIVDEFGIVPKNRLYQRTNKAFVDIIDTILDYTNKHSKNGIIDRKDLLQLFNSEGVGLISEVNLTDLSDLKLTEEDFALKIKESWNKSIFTTTDHSKIVRAGIIFDGQESLMDYLRYDLIFESFNSMPIDLFEGIYLEKTNGRALSFLTGLSWIDTRVKKIEDEIEAKKHKISLNRDDSNKQVNKFKELNVELRKTNTPKRSAMDILNKYNR